MRLDRQIEVLAIGVLAAALGAAQVADDLFQKALTKERVDGRYGDAVALYRQVLKQFPKDRAIAARSLLHIGECMEKQGNAEARRAYEQLLRDYPDQRDAVEQAKAHVAALVSAAAPAIAGMTSRQVWVTSEDTDEGSVSPDGRMLVFPDWSTGDLAFRDLSTGEVRRLTHTGGWNQSDEFGGVSRFSHSGRQIAYAWFAGRGKGYELRVMNADGSGARTVHTLERPGYVEPLAWSPDDSEIFVARYDEQGLTSGIAVAVKGGASRTIIDSAPQNRIMGASYSPDGMWLVCSLPSKDDRQQNDLFIVASRGGAPAVLAANPSQDIWPVWSTDGSRIYFVSDRAGDFALWEAPVEAGRQSGSARLVKTGLGTRQVTGLGLARDAFYYTTTTGMEDISIAKLDPVSGRVTSPVAISDRNPGANRHPMYSPDGELLAYQTLAAERGKDTVQITIRTVRTGHERVITLDRAQVPGPMLLWGWHPTGKALVMIANLGANTSGIATVDIENGKIALREIADTRTAGAPAYSLDGKALYRIYRHWPGGEFQVLAEDVATGATNVLYRTSQPIRNIALSRDGTKIALWRVDDTKKIFELMVLRTAGGDPILLLSRPSEKVLAAGLAFSPDGHWIYYAGREDMSADLPGKLLRVSVEGGAPQETGLSTTWLTRFSIHPNGNRIAFASGSRSAEVWMLENFVPTAMKTNPRRK